MVQTPANPKAETKLFISLAWIVTLVISLLPDILVRELSGSLPAWLYWAKVGLILMLLLFSLSWERLHPLRPFFSVLLAVYLLQWVVEWFYYC